MLTVAYLANQFPAAVEPYVSDEIEELRRRGIRVLAGSVRTPGLEKSAPASPSGSKALCLQSLRVMTLLRGGWLAVSRCRRVLGLLARVLLHGEESPKRRFKALLHTALGAYYAALLKDRGVHHIHVHHGYFASWIGMVAAQLLGINFSLTLHGSDLLLKASYLDAKLENCLFCITISDYNRQYILWNFSEIDARKIVVSRLGVDVPSSVRSRRKAAGDRLQLLAIGRLHPVKDHAFLVRACTLLRDAGIDFQCTIAGEGPERERLEALIRQSCLHDRLFLFGYASPQQIDSLYSDSDVVVLTSRSEGIPLVLMEAMARGKIVLAPAITGIPEIVIPGKTGFLYASGMLDDFVAKILLVRELTLSEQSCGAKHLDWIRHAAQLQILHNFNCAKNLAHFADQFLQRTSTADSSPTPISPLSTKRPPGRVSSADLIQPGLERPA